MRVFGRFKDEGRQACPAVLNQCHVFARVRIGVPGVQQITRAWRRVREIEGSRVGSALCACGCKYKRPADRAFGVQRGSDSLASHEAAVVQKAQRTTLTDMALA